MEIEPNFSKVLKQLPPSSCPPKIQAATSTEITFAARVIQLQNGEYQFQTSLGGDLFCYLPTSVECGLPYLVNANFILSQDRNTIIENPWNTFLLKAIGHHQFRWFGEIAKDKRFRRSVLTLLSQEDATTVFPTLERRFRGRDQQELKDGLLAAYQAGYESGLKSVPFVLSKEGALLRLDESVIDLTSIFKEFDEKFFDEELLSEGKSRLIAYDLENRGLLENFKTIEKYDWQCLRKKISEYLEKLKDQKFYDLRSKMIIFLCKVEQSSIFKSAKILTNRSEMLCSPEESFLPEKNQDIQIFSEFKDLNIVSIEKYSAAAIKALSKIVECLNVVSFITTYVGKLIQNNGINDANLSIRLLRFIYEAWKNKKLDKRIFEGEGKKIDLGRFKVITHSRSGTMRELQACIKPNEQLKDVDFSGRTIHPRYFMENDNSEVWNELLLCAGVKTDLEFIKKPINYIDLCNYFKNKFKKQELIEEYVTYIISKVPVEDKGIPKSARTEADKNKLTFDNFIFFDFIFYEEEISKSALHLFLMVINKHFYFLNEPPTMKRKLQNRSYTIPICEHFLVYYFRQKIEIAVKGSLRSARSEYLLYGEKFEELFDRGRYPIDIADLPQAIQLTPEVSRMLNFKQGLSVDDALSLLTDVSESYHNRKADKICIQRLGCIYKLIIEIEINEKSKERVSAWKRQKGALLSLNSSFQLAEALQIYDKNSLPEEDEHTAWLHPVGLEIHVLHKIANFFQLLSFSQNLDFVPTISQNNEIKKDVEKLRQFILKLLPIAALIESEHLALDHKKQHEEIFLKFYQCRFLACDSIKFNSGPAKMRNWVGMKEGDLYISGRLTLLLEDIANELSAFIFKSSQAKIEFRKAVLNFTNHNYFEDLGCSVLNSSDKKEKYNKMIEFQNSKLEKEVDYVINESSNSNKSTTIGADQSKESEGEKIDVSKLSINESKGVITPPPSPSQSTHKRENNNQPLKGRRLNFDIDNKAIDGKGENVHFSPVTAKFPHLNNPPSSPSTTSSPSNNTAGSSPDSASTSPLRFSPAQLKGKEKPLPPLGNSFFGVPRNKKADAKSPTTKEDEEKQAEKDAKNKKLGDEGERRVFKEIEKILKNQIGVEPVPIAMNDKTQKEIGPGSRFIKNNLVVDLIWFNKDKGDKEIYESPVDLVIRVNGEISYYIEVKSTDTKKNPIFFLTSNEWRYMQEKRNSSILVRVYDVNENIESRFEIYRDPFGMITKNLIAFMSGGKFRLNVSSEEALGKEHCMRNYEDEKIGCRLM